MAPTIALEHSYADRLVGAYAEQEPVPVATPHLIRFNQSLAAELGIDTADLTDGELAAMFSGNTPPSAARPLSQAYAGHQFGSYNPQLGDGRQVVYGELVAPDGHRYDLALKGSGRTPFSRGGDGRASLGPVLREYLMGEAMHALGVPTTRALAVVGTGEPVMRSIAEPGAVLTRVASSHLRVGTFQWVAARGDRDLLERLVDYALWRHPPADSGDPGDRGDNRALTLLAAVVERQASLIATWMHLGFIHGVMNTDNCTISGETIDYGPCAFLDRFDPAAVFSSIDHGGRYAYGNQPTIGLWNLARLAEALVPLIAEDVDRAVAQASDVLDRYQPHYDEALLTVGRRKLGAPDADRALLDDFFALLADTSTDLTLAWRRLANAAAGDDEPLRRLIDGEPALETWLARWDLVVDRSAESVADMRAASPVYIPRNHLVEESLAAAVDGDLAPFDRLLAVVTDPFTERIADTRYAHPAPESFTAGYQTFCGT